MKISATLFWATLVAIHVAGEPPVPKAKFTVGKETTYVTGPLDKDGFIDYSAALNERLGKGVTAENNANVLIWKAVGPKVDGRPMPAEFFKLMGMPAPPDAGDYFIELRAFARARGEVADDLLPRATRGPWSAKEYSVLADWLKANEKPLALAVEASRRKRYFDPTVPGRTESGGPDLLLGALGRSAWRSGGLARALACRAMLKLGEHHCDEAWQDLLACHRLGRLVTQSASVLEIVAGVTIDRTAAQADTAILADRRLTAEQLRRYGQDLRQLPPLRPVADKIDLAGRLIYLDALQFIHRDGAGVPGAKLGAKAQQAMARLDFEPAMRHGNLCFDRLAAALRLPDRAARAKELARFDDDFKEWSKQVKEAGELENLLNDPDLALTVVRVIGILTLGQTLPAAGKVQENAERLEQAHRNLQVAFALAAYQRDHKGYPKALADLAPNYLDKVPDDLFTGKSLVYRPSENGLVLYSLGPNGQDDDGRGPDDDPKGDDIAIRLPVPAKK